RPARADRSVPDACAVRVAGAPRARGDVRRARVHPRRSRHGPRVRTLAALAYVLGGIHAGGHRVLPVGYAPAWSPNAERIAYVTRGDLWVADRDGTHRALLVKHADQPAWSPNGRRLAFSRDGWVWTIRADRLDERRLARGTHPDWSPNGQRLAFDRDGEVYTAHWWY